MAIKRFHIRDAHKRRGDILPARLRFSAQRGVTLVELMISMLILTLVCVAWLEIIGIQSAKKEARRREAVERLAGMMDAFMYVKRHAVRLSSGGYRMMLDIPTMNLEFQDTSDIKPVFENDTSIGYQLRVIATGDDAGMSEFNELCGRDWTKNFKQWGYQNWLVGVLYNGVGARVGIGKPFFSLPVCLGYQNFE